AVLAYQAMRADSSIVADSLERAFPTVKDVRGYRLGVLGITGGYGFSLKIGRNFFINGKMLLGITREFGRYLDNNGERISGNRKMGTSSEFNVGIGSNGNRFYWELSALAYTLSNPFDQVNYFTTNFNSLRLHAGYRFDYKPGKFMRKLGL
ncbi:MAG: DUF4421 family protein, partial [Flavobacteriales bacterium]|nr:DUF4421 family protein [Flavobacteriales bacterium]